MNIKEQTVYIIIYSNDGTHFSTEDAYSEASAEQIADSHSFSTIVKIKTDITVNASIYDPNF